MFESILEIIIIVAKPITSEMFVIKTTGFFLLLSTLASVWNAYSLRLSEYLVSEDNLRMRPTIDAFLNGGVATFALFIINLFLIYALAVLRLESITVIVLFAISWSMDKAFSFYLIKELKQL